MDELKQLINDRFKRVNQILKSSPSPQHLRFLKQQEKMRSQKQNWIISMIKLNKNLSTHLKQSYYQYSFEIMKIIDPNFSDPLQKNTSTNKNPQKYEENFFNDFITLYKTFFDKFQEKFIFKIKIKNFLRPTNHNILQDLIKYLSDFSKDYYQQTFFWHAKPNFRKQEKTKETSNEEIFKSNAVIEIVEKSQTTFARQGIRSQSIANVYQTQLKRYQLVSETNLNSNTIIISNNKKQLTLLKNYEILDISSLPNLVNLERNPNNIEIMKLRMNELFRDMKYRNAISKSTYNNYLSGYQQTYPGNQKIRASDQYIFNRMTYPYKITLVVQKNGFSCINVALHEVKNPFLFIKRSEDCNYLSPIKNNQRQSVQIDDRQTDQFLNNRNIGPLKHDYLINSLKVLRMSQNFLPSLIKSLEEDNQTGTQKKEKNYEKTSSKLSSITEIQEKKQKNEKLRYYNVEAISAQKKKQQQKKRFGIIRKHFTSEEKYKNKKSKRGNNDDPEQKILEWLDKIKVMKEIQKKKILGII